MHNDAYRAADEIIDALLEKGFGYYFIYRENIALAFWNDILSGNWEITIKNGDLKLRVIQEDEYDQHMDFRDDTPEWNAMLCHVSSIPSYVWIVD